MEMHKTHGPNGPLAQCRLVKSVRILDLHPETGQYALEAAGLAEQFHGLARSEGEEHKIFSPSGELLVHHISKTPDAPGGRPEIDRTDLRDLLVGSLPAATIRWGAQVVATDDRAGGGFRLPVGGQHDE